MLVTMFLPCKSLTGLTLVFVKRLPILLTRAKSIISNTPRRSDDKNCLARQFGDWNQRKRFNVDNINSCIIFFGIIWSYDLVP